MADHGFDPLMHEPERLRITATLAALPAGGGVSLPRLQAMTGLAPGHLVARLSELGQADYVRTGKSGGDGAQPIAALTGHGRAALHRYASDLRQPGPVGPVPGPDTRAGDADRDV